MLLPTVITTSVVRSTHQGDSHGGVYLIDLESGDLEQVIDWNDPTISWEGRGADRGLRGVAFYRDNVLIAASDELFVYDQDFTLLDSYKNRYLKHCHEISADEDELWLTSTGFDSVLRFDLRKRSFVAGYHFRRFFPLQRINRWRLFPRYRVREFDPHGIDGPRPKDRLHINNVRRVGSHLLISGTGFEHMLRVRDDSVEIASSVPRGTHNVQPFRDGILLNHTATNQIAYLSRRGRLKKSFAITVYPENQLTHASLPKDHARQGFGRGLCTLGQSVIIGGSSPATITVFDFESGELLKTVNITMDVRNAVHGLEIWPFSPGEHCHEEAL